MIEPQKKIATEEFDFIINYTPLPPEQREEWERAIRVLNEIIDSVLEQNLQKQYLESLYRKKKTMTKKLIFQGGEK